MTHADLNLPHWPTRYEQLQAQAREAEALQLARELQGPLLKRGDTQVTVTRAFESACAFGMVAVLVATVFAFGMRTGAERMDVAPSAIARTGR